MHRGGFYVRKDRIRQALDNIRGDRTVSRSRLRETFVQGLIGGNFRMP